MPCGRRPHHHREQRPFTSQIWREPPFIAKHGGRDELPEPLTILADCPKARALPIYDRWHVRYERHYGLNRPGFLRGRGEL